MYVHFPWCLSKCGYCDFYSVATPAGDAIDHEGYADQVLRELERRLEPFALNALPALTTIYIGGGTPSLWRPKAISRVIAGVLSAFSVDSRTVEVTVECNPSSFDRSIADQLSGARVNRVSLGIQSLDNQQLRFLGRRHDRQLALRALDDALDSAIELVSADMIFGLPGQPLAAEVEQILEVANRPLAHLSAYALTIEEQTPFGRLARQGRLPIAPDERIADAFVAVHAAVERAGFEHYEISNFARNGKRSCHNQQYWWGWPYLGLGAGAFGTVELAGQWMRYQNPANIAQYLSLPFCDDRHDVYSDGGLVELLDAETRLRERLMLGLRLREGLDFAELGAELGLEPMTRERRQALETLLAQGRLAQSGSRYYIDPSAWLLADGTIAQLI